MLQPCRLVSVTYLNSAIVERKTVLYWAKEHSRVLKYVGQGYQGFTLVMSVFALKDHLTCDICLC